MLAIAHRQRASGDRGRWRGLCQYSRTSERPASRRASSSDTRDELEDAVPQHSLSEVLVHEQALIQHGLQMVKIDLDEPVEDRVLEEGPHAQIQSAQRMPLDIWATSQAGQDVIRQVEDEPLEL